MFMLTFQKKQVPHEQVVFLYSQLHAMFNPYYNFQLKTFKKIL